MKAERTQLYIHYTKSNNEIVYTGIDFREFAGWIDKPMENLLLLKAECLGNNNQKNFELVEDNEYLQQFIKEEEYRFGDFCFLDYEKEGMVERLSDEQISQMLFLAHMFRPLNSPFFDTLKNRFAYLAHDNGFFCKLYCRHLEEFLRVLAMKISTVLSKLTCIRIEPPCCALVSEMLGLAEQGLYMDLKAFSTNEQDVILDVYTIGKITDMDIVYNYAEKRKTEATCVYKLIYRGQKNLWKLTKE